MVAARKIWKEYSMRCFLGKGWGKGVKVPHEKYGEYDKACSRLVDIHWKKI